VQYLHGFDLGGKRLRLVVVVAMLLKCKAVSGIPWRITDGYTLLEKLHDHGALIKGPWRVIVVQFQPWHQAFRRNLEQFRRLHIWVYFNLISSSISDHCSKAFLRNTILLYYMNS
jgi:hypothetical protein